MSNCTHNVACSFVDRIASAGVNGGGSGGTRHFSRVIGIVSVLGVASITSAEVVVYSGSQANPSQRLAWEAQVGEWSTLDFTGLPSEEPIPEDLYAAEFGVTLTNGLIFSYTSESGFLLDGQGFAASQGSAGSSVDVVFDTPVHAFAVDFPGVIRFTLFFEDEVIAHLPGPYGGFVGWFAGLISDQPFDRVRVWDTDAFGVDDLRFGMVVPGPATALVLLPGLGLLGGRRRSG